MGSGQRVLLAAALSVLCSCNAIAGFSDLEKVTGASAVDASAVAPEQVAVGRKTSCVVLADKTVRCWGANPGVAPGTVSKTAVKVKKLKDVTLVSIGLEHACAVDESGTVSCWGRNDAGQLGDGTNEASAEPKAVPSLPVIDTVTLGANHTCAFTSPDRDPVQGYCWGDNALGQLGDGTQVSKNVPVKITVPAGMKIFRISAGAGFTAAIFTNAGIFEGWCWGANDKAQCGQDPKTMPRVAMPTKIPGLPPLERVYAGTDHTCGRTSGTKLPWCWGANESGQIGTNRKSAYELPAAVVGPAAQSVNTMQAGVRHTCLSLDPSQDVYCWGANDLGQFGSEPGATQTLAMAVPALNDTSFAIRQAEHGCAIAKREVTCFGSNDSGQLGNGKVANTGPAAVVKLP